MDLQIPVFLLFFLFTAGHSLSCYECKSVNDSCAGQKVKTCPSGSSQCASSTFVSQIDYFSYKVKGKDCASVCQSGSMNSGMIKSTFSCCNTDQCNLQDAPDPSNVPNGKKCYTIDNTLQNRTIILSCSGTEDRCFKVTWGSEKQSVVVKGCVSKSLCDAVASDPGGPSFSCCEGNLCNGAQNVSQSFTYNGAQSVSQSFLFLCCSLLSYFLLH